MAQVSDSKLWMVLVPVGIVAIVVIALKSKPKDNIPWTTNYQDATAQATTNHKLMVLDFYADWCGPCRRMASETWPNQFVSQAMTDYVPVRINIDDQNELAQRFGITGIPTVVAVDSGGRVVNKHVGGMSADDLLSWLHETGK